MTFKITQYAWFKWFDDDGNDAFDDRAMLFQATLDGAATSTYLRVRSVDGYYLDVYGTDLEVDGDGILSGGTINRVVFFQSIGNTKMAQFDGTFLDVAGYRDDYENDVTYPDNPDALGMIFDASAVPAQPGGLGIGTYGTNNGNDTIDGSGGADELIAFKGDDIVRGNGGNDLVWGYEGNDSLYGGTGNDQLLGYTGNDKLYGESGSDYIWGEDGKDTLDGGSGNDDVYGGAGNDDVKGGTGHDFLVGDTGKDTLNGGSGHDWATASLDSTKSDSFTIDLAKKTIKSAYGTDKLSSIENAYGSAGKDLIKGNSGDNALIGVRGNDTLEGGSGDDRLWGGVGKDVLTGGSGKDSFVFWEYGPPYRDKITDFKHGTDKIVLFNDPFEGMALGKLKSSNFVVGTKAKDGNDHIIYDKKTGTLYYDEDGKGGIVQTPFAILQGKPTLTASDFKIVQSTDFNDFWLV